MLAWFTSEEKGAADRLLAALAPRLAAEGVRVAGAVQVNTERPGRRHPDMDLRVLTGGDAVRISQDLGPFARGCRLDPDGLERAVALVAGALADADLLIVNKFGKQEAEGRGFQPMIAEALIAGLPVLIAVAPSNRAAFAAFADGMGEELPGEAEALRAWCRGAVGAVV